MQHVLIGELAEVLHGSPLPPVSGTVMIVARAGQREHLGAAIATAGGQPTDQANLQRLADALDELHAAIRVRSGEPPVPLPADPRLLARAEILNLEP